jgi:hypothetical protein
MSACPACGSNRLKGAPLPLVSLILTPLFPRRRYRCADCRWSGWKRRLRRRHDAWNIGSLGRSPDANERAVWSLLPVLALLVLWSALMSRSCAADNNSKQIEQPPLGLFQIDTPRPSPHSHESFTSLPAQGS